MRLAAGLESLVAMVKRDERKRSPMEAKRELTDAYLHLMLAIGFARLGESDRASALELEAGAVLEPRHDKLHDVLLACFRHRITEATAGRTVASDLPPDLVAQISSLRREERYKLDRLLDHTVQLEPNRIRGERTDFMEVWLRPGRPLRPAGDAKLLALAAMPFEEGQLQLAGTLASVPLESLPTRALVCFIAGRLGHSETVRDLVPHIQSNIGDAAEVETTLRLAARALEWCGMRDELVTLVDAVGERADHSTTVRFIVAGARAFVGEPGSDTIFEHGFYRLDPSAESTLQERLPVARQIAIGASYAGLEAGTRYLARLALRAKTITDSYGANSHFCLSVLDFYEGMIVGLTELELANLDVLDPASQPLLRSGFVF